MDYEGQICRAPMERASFMLPVAVGYRADARADAAIITFAFVRDRLRLQESRRRPILLKRDSLYG